MEKANETQAVETEVSTEATEVVEVTETVDPKIEALNQLLATFAKENDVEIGEVTLQKNGRISASYLQKVNTGSPRISAQDKMNFDKAVEKYKFSGITLGEKFEHYGSIKPKSNHVKVTEFEVVSARPLAKKDDIITIERIENGVRTNVSVEELKAMKDELVLEETAWLKNGSHFEETKGTYEGYIMPKNYEEDLDESLIEDVDYEA